jgi:polysaccharide chain length determinant protein (PEP-CTERM system associated)
MQPEKPEPIRISYYLRLVSKRRWFVIIPFCIAMVVGLYLAVTLPKIYESGTLILVMPQRVPADYVKAIVSSDIDARISTISQQILSRTNLQKVIAKFGLFSGSHYDDMFMEDKIADLRKRIGVTVNKTDRRRQADAFSITFRGPHPQKVMKITNGLAGSFIEENLKVREAQAVGTSDFLEDELQTKRRRLTEVENRLREYRRKYMGELPEQLDANLKILERLQTQLSEREKSLRDARARLVTMASEIASNKKFLTDSDSSVQTPGGESSSLAQLKAQLAALESSYTQRHPDVIRLKARIAEMEKKYENGQLEETDPLTAVSSGDPAARMVSRTITTLIQQRNQVQQEIKNLQVEISQINRQVSGYQQRVEQTPKREQELMSLRRDYDNIQASYDSLLNRKLEAEIAVNMEKKQKGEQFRIIDYAALPRTPVSPDLVRLLLLCVAAGLGVGGGLIYLLEFLDTSVKQSRNFEAEFGLPVLVSIPKILHPRDQIKRRLNQLLTACSLLVATVLTAAFVAVVFVGIEPTLQLVRQYVGG